MIVLHESLSLTHPMVFILFVFHTAVSIFVLPLFTVVIWDDVSSVETFLLSIETEAAMMQNSSRPRLIAVMVFKESKRFWFDLR